MKNFTGKVEISQESTFLALSLFSWESCVFAKMGPGGGAGTPKSIWKSIGIARFGALGPRGTKRHKENQKSQIG